MNQTYQDYDEESTNTVRAKKKQGETLLITVYYIIWVTAMVVLVRKCEYTDED